ncbi:hypothetical protein [Kitasatospora sp. NPDC085464]|uniref:hypothetical protein n=1 Tax=Kitasatospora sp. NPDC085464 TaxID=3364063 RepID=UPI0037C64EB5
MTAPSPVRSLLTDAALAVLLALALASPAVPALGDPVGPAAACTPHPVDRSGDTAGPCGR